MDDKIGDFLELEPLEQDITTANALVKDSKLDNDYEYARGNLYQVIENGAAALNDLLQVAQQGQHPRAYEVVATLVRTLSDANMTLMDITKKKQDIANDEGGKKDGPNTVNNTLFVGSTGELQKLIKKQMDDGTS
jgi:hypothetical protein|tara:strand:- start:585 stop:989 length:405 start_codon:yes stop_codon:yes gene_type:complete